MLEQWFRNVLIDYEHYIRLRNFVKKNLICFQFKYTDLDFVSRCEHLTGLILGPESKRCIVSRSTETNTWQELFANSTAKNGIRQHTLVCNLVDLYSIWFFHSFWIYEFLTTVEYVTNHAHFAECRENIFCFYLTELRPMLVLLGAWGQRPP